MIEKILKLLVNAVKSRTYTIGVDNALFYNLIDNAADRFRREGFRIDVNIIEPKENEIDNTKYDVLILTKYPNLVKLNSLIVITTIPDLWKFTNKPVIITSPSQLGLSVNKVLYALSISTKVVKNNDERN